MFDVIIRTQSNYDDCRTVELHSLFARNFKQRVGALFAGLSSNAVCVWDMHGRLINKMLHNRKYASIAIINENEIACGGAAHTVWNFYSHKPRILFDATKTGVVFSPKKDVLIYKHSNVIQVWNTKRNCCLTIVQLGQDQDLRLDQAETMKRINNTLMVILTNKTLTIFNYETKKVVTTISLTTFRITTSISVLNEQIYVRDPGNLARVDINTRAVTLVAKMGTIFGLEMLSPTSFAYSAGESIYYSEGGVKREVKRGAKGLLARKEAFLVYQDNRNNLILFDPVLLCDEMKLVGLKGECKEFCFYFSQLISMGTSYFADVCIDNYYVATAKELQTLICVLMSDGRVFGTKAQYVHLQLTLNGFSLLVENVQDSLCHSCNAFFIMNCWKYRIIVSRLVHDSIGSYYIFIG
jgi:hypothetical protein